MHGWDRTHVGVSRICPDYRNCVDWGGTAVMKRLVSALGALALLPALAACGSSDDTADAAESAPTSAVQADSDPSVLTLDEVESMLAALEDMTGASRNEIRISAISYSPAGSLAVDALDPAAPTEFNQYIANIYTDRREIRPYDYGGADKYEALEATLFPAGEVTPEIVHRAWEDSFTRVEGDPAELDASGPRVSRDRSGVVEIAIVNGPERDRQSVYYDAQGNFVEVS